MLKKDAPLQLRSAEPETVTGPTIGGLAVALVSALARLDAFERVFYGGLLLLGVGLALAWPPLGLIVPGAALSATALVLKVRKT